MYHIVRSFRQNNKIFLCLHPSKKYNEILTPVTAKQCVFGHLSGMTTRIVYQHVLVIELTHRRSWPIAGEGGRGGRPRSRKIMVNPGHLMYLIKARANVANMLAQHHPTLLTATCFGGGRGIFSFQYSLFLLAIFNIPTFNIPIPVFTYLKYSFSFPCIPIFILWIYYVVIVIIWLDS